MKHAVFQYRKRRPGPGGHTLIELIIAMGSATILMAGLGASIALTSRAFRPETSDQYVKTSSAFAQADLLTDLRLAIAFTERTKNAATFIVPDRDGDGEPETLRYAWSGTPGDPLLLSYNQTSPIVVVRDVHNFDLRYITHDVSRVALTDDEDNEDDEDEGD